MATEIETHKVSFSSHTLMQKLDMAFLNTVELKLLQNLLLLVQLKRSALSKLYKDELNKKNFFFVGIRGCIDIQSSKFKRFQLLKINSVFENSN